MATDGRTLIGTKGLCGIISGTVIEEDTVLVSMLCVCPRGHTGPHSWERHSWKPHSVLCGAVSGVAVCTYPREHAGRHSWETPEPYGAFPDVPSPLHNVTVQALVEHVAAKVAERVEDQLRPLLEQLLRERK